MNVDKIAQLSPHTVGDLWDEINREFSSTEYLFWPADGINYNLRLVGPFVFAQRFFLSSPLKFVTDAELKSVLNGDQDAYKKVVEKARLWLPKKKSAASNALELLERMTANKWQRSILVNVMVRDALSVPRKPKVLSLGENVWRTLTQKMIVDLECSESDFLNIKINGLQAHDILFSKRGQLLNSKYNISASKKPCTLTDAEINVLVSNGLVDILPLLKALNKATIKKRKGYIYKAASKYVMPPQFCGYLKEIADMEENQHLEQIEANIHELPPDAFDNSSQFNNPISSLEL